MNPASRGGSSKKVFKRIFELLDSYAINYQYEVTSCMEDAYTFSVDANKQNYDSIIAVGGDGTINQVLNGFYDKEGKITSNSKFGVIYTGTSPDFCKSYNIPTSLYEAVMTIINNISVNIQVAKIIYHRDDSDSNLSNNSSFNSPGFQTKYFACCANIGIGAAIARQANSGIRKYLGDFSGTFISLFKALWHYKASNISVSIDGNTKQDICKHYNLSVGRTKYIASGIKINNEFSNNDGAFYCLFIHNLRFVNLPGLIRKLYGDKDIINSDYISLSFCHKIEIYGESMNCEVEFDGDPQGYLPCKIEAAKDTLGILVNN